MSDNDRFDFGGPIPPDVPDGAYSVQMTELDERKSEDGKADPCFYMVFKILSAENEDGAAAVNLSVTHRFWPKTPDARYFRSHLIEVKNLCRAFNVSPPKVDLKGNLMDEWRPFLESLMGVPGTIFVANEEAKNGKIYANVKFTQPRKKSL